MFSCNRKAFSLKIKINGENSKSTKTTRTDIKKSNREIGGTFDGRKDTR
jgi:hypothetical protein